MLFDVYLLEFRMVFESVDMKGIHSLPTLVNSNAVFKESYSVFTHCQARSVEFKKKLNLVFEFATKFRLNNSHFSFLHPFKEDQPSSLAGKDSSDVIEAQKKRIYQLEEELKNVHSDADDLERRLFEVSLEKDKTPNALLFFVALNDLETTENLRQLLIQIKQLRLFAECKSHLDFVDLRRRLLVCVSSAPYIERFLASFNTMHSQWRKRRLTLFERRAIADEDEAFNMISSSTALHKGKGLLKISGHPPQGIILSTTDTKQDKNVGGDTGPQGRFKRK